jgi:hypothetical protein
VYVNPIVYEFWSNMQIELLSELALKNVPLIVTGDGQESITFFIHLLVQT